MFRTNAFPYEIVKEGVKYSIMIPVTQENDRGEFSFPGYLQNILEIVWDRLFCTTFTEGYKKRSGRPYTWSPAFGNSIVLITALTWSYCP